MLSYFKNRAKTSLKVNELALDKAASLLPVFFLYEKVISELEQTHFANCYYFIYIIYIHIYIYIYIYN